jgi:hypothetical protein
MEQPVNEESFLQLVLNGEIPPPSEQRTMALEFLAVDVCARRMHFEKRWFQNEDARAWVLLDQVRTAIATGDRLRYVQEVLKAELQSIAVTLPPESNLRVIYANLWLALPPEPWVAAKEARSFHMSHLVDYAGCWIDKARSGEGKWFSDRLSWWLQEGSQFYDPLLAYQAAEIPASYPSDLARMLLS